MTILDPAWVQSQLTALPFVVIDGPNYAFRSGHLSGITPTGITQLRDLGIKKIFDLRADIELTKFGYPPPNLGPWAQLLHTPIFKDEYYSPQGLTLRSKLYGSGKAEDVLEVYTEILNNGDLAFKAVFEHIRDRPHDAFLFHCSAGKDRSGVLAALILKAAGANDDSIAKDYELTEVGLEPTRAATAAKFLTFPEFAGDVQAVNNTLSTRRESIIAFSLLLEEKYGGIEGYLERQLGFSATEVAIIRSNLVLGSDIS